MVESRTTMRREGVWAAWTAWSECSLTCGRGVLSRYRDCVAADDDGQRGSMTQTLDQCHGRDSDFVVCTENVATYAVITIAIRLRYDYDPTTTYRARLLPFDAIRREQKMNTLIFRRSRVVVVS